MRPNDPQEDDTDAAKKLLARSEESVFSSASFQSKRSVETELSPKAARMLEDVRRLAMDNPEGARGAALWLVALLTSRTLSKSGRTKGGLAAWQQRKIEQYLKENLQHPLRVDELAQQVPLSVSYFCRAFKKTFGTSPHEYVIQLRLERSRELMLSTTDPLSQIALDCGFSDQAHLSKLFRRGTGESPSVWRQRNLNDVTACERKRVLRMVTTRRTDCGQ